jgi:site-specific DNA recombinase
MKTKLYTRKKKSKKQLMANTNLAIIYVRVSQAEQVDGTSLESQERACRKYLTEQGLVLACEPFVEEGESAKTTDRKKLLAAIDYCRQNKGKIAAFVVWKVDRFARNMEDHFSVKATLIKYGTTLHSVTEPIDNSATGKFMESMLAAVAEFDNDIRAGRCRGGLQDRIRSGIYPYKPPVGYINMQNKKNGQKKTQPDPIHPVLFPMIQNALKGFRMRQFTSTDMLKYLKSSNFVEISGLVATPQLIDRILYQYLDYYAGKLYCVDDDRYVDGKHQPMITVEERDEIVAVRDGKRSNKTIIKNRDNEDFPLRRLVRCAVCDEQVTASTSRGRSGIYYPSYHCFKKECPMKNKVLRKSVIEADFMDLLNRITPASGMLEYMNAVISQRQSELLGVLRQQHADQAAKVNEVKAKRMKIYELAESGLYTKEMVRERLDALELELLTTKITLHEDSIDLLEAEFEKEYFNVAVQSISRLWLDLSPDMRRGFQNIVFPEGLVYTKNEGFSNPVLSRIYTLSSDATPESVGMVDPRRFELPASSVQMRRSTK